MIYFAYNGKYIKIGYTNYNPAKRLKQLQTSSPQQLILLGYFQGNKELEKYLHKKFAYLNINLEWFKVDDELINFINENNIMKNNHYMLTYVDWDYKGEKLMTYSRMPKSVSG